VSTYFAVLNRPTHISCVAVEQQRVALARAFGSAPKHHADGRSLSRVLDNRLRDDNPRDETLGYFEMQAGHRFGYAVTHEPEKPCACRRNRVDARRLESLQQGSPL